MKKTLVLILLAINAVGCLAQTKVSEYHSDYFNRDYDISASLNESETAIENLYISVTGKSDSETVILRFKNPSSLVTILKYVKRKYEEWIKIANDNNVTDMSKDIPMSLPSATVCWHGTKWWFAFNKEFKFRFMILNSGKKVIAIHDKVNASSNEYIDQEFYWVFESVKEMDDFINKIDIKAFESQLMKNSNNADLFQ